MVKKEKIRPTILEMETTENPIFMAKAKIITQRKLENPSTLSPKL
jgi:hypothetical protein